MSILNAVRDLLSVTLDVFAASRTLRKPTHSLAMAAPSATSATGARTASRSSTSSHHRYDVLLLINGVPVVQTEVKTVDINPRRAIEQTVEYKNDPRIGHYET